MTGPDSGLPSRLPGTGGGVERGWVYLISAVVVAYVVLIAATFLDYGITFDEEFHARYGDTILAWYLSGFRTDYALTYWTLIYYGGFFDALAQAATRFSPFGMYETRHLLNALFGAVGVAMAAALAARLRGGLAGVLTAVFLILTPVYYGHAFANPKDIPFAVMYIASLYCIVRSIEQFPRPSWRMVALLGSVIGLTLAVRFGGILLFGYLALAFLLWLLMEWRRGRGSFRPVPAVAAFAPRFAVALVAAWAMMLVWWPKAQVDPIGHPLRTLRTLGKFPWNYTVFFEGRDIHATELPWYYIPKWLLITAPEFLLLALAVAFVAGTSGLIRRWRASGRSEGGGKGGEAVPDVLVIAMTTITVAVALPVTYAAVSGATLYDGLRHFLFIVPILAVLGGCGMATALRARRPVAWLIGMAVGVSAVLTAADMIRLHPYEYVFFNRTIAGGLEGAAVSYETDYWGASGREGALWVAAHYDRRDDGTPIRVATCMQQMSTAYYLPESRFVHVEQVKSPDLFLANTRWNCHEHLEGRVVHVVERDGVALLYVKQLGSHVTAKGLNVSGVPR